MPTVPTLLASYSSPFPTIPIDPPKPNREGEEDELEFGFEGVDEADESHLLDDKTCGDEEVVVRHKREHDERVRKRVEVHQDSVLVVVDDDCLMCQKICCQ